MNLHAIVSGLVGVVNPNVPLTVKVSKGSSVDASGSRTPLYGPAAIVMGNVQSMTYRDLVQVEGLNLNGDKRSIYLQGVFNGVVRPQMKGGDIVIDGTNNTWLVAQVLEQWPDWCKVAVTLQNG